MGKDKKAKLKIPKEIAGVKIPKDLRKKAKVALALAESPMARELLAAGLTAAAAALAKSGDSEKKPQTATPPAPEPEAGTNAAKPRKRQAFAAVAKDIALGVAAAYAEEATKKAKQNGGSAATPKPEPGAH